MPERIFSSREFSDITGIPLPTIQAWVSRKHFPNATGGTRLVFTFQDLLVGLVLREAIPFCGADFALEVSKEARKKPRGGMETLWVLKYSEKSGREYGVHWATPDVMFDESIRYMAVNVPLIRKQLEDSIEKHAKAVVGATA